jgi:hypothetical protein
MYAASKLLMVSLDTDSTFVTASLLQWPQSSAKRSPHSVSFRAPAFRMEFRAKKGKGTA